MIQLEILVEELSAEPVVRRLAETLLPPDAIGVRVFDGKDDLLGSLPQRLAGYRRRNLDGLRILVLVDRDRDECNELKRRMEEHAAAAGFTTRSTSRHDHFEVCNRIAVEELEAWLLGDEPALRAAFPRLRPFAKRAKFREPDGIHDAWETAERLLQRAGYYSGGLRKVDFATRVAAHLDPAHNRSVSFGAFMSGMRQLVATAPPAS